MGRYWLAAAALVLPWLTPFAGGPSSAAHPWMVAAACTLVLLALAAGPVPWRMAGPLLALALWAACRPGQGGMEKYNLAVYVALVLAAASAASGWLRRAPDASLLARGWLVAALASVAIGLLQYFGSARGLQPWVYAAEIGEALSNLRQRNQFASLCVIGAAALLWLAPAQRLRPSHLLAMALLATGAAATTSRTGLLQFLLLGLLTWCWRPAAGSGKLRLWGVGLLAYALAAVLLPRALEAWMGVPAQALWERVASVGACSSRQVLWSNVLHLITRQPLAGWGWGELDYAHYLTLYPGARFCDILDNAHNLPLHLAVELGLPVALLACGGVVWWVLRARPWAEAQPQRQLAWAVLMVLAVHSLLEYPLWYGPFQIALGLSLGLLANPGAAAPVLAARTRGAIAACGLAVLAYAAWDYERVSQVYLEPDQRRAAWRENTLAAVRKSWLFSGQARFAELTLSSLERANLAWTDETAQAMLHYSPEPRVIERAIESATMAGRYDDAVLHLARYRAAFPEDYAKWKAGQKVPLPALDAR